MTKDEALRLALEALERMRGYGDVFLCKSYEQKPYDQMCEAIAAIKQALEQPEHQPKADIATLPEPEWYYGIDAHGCLHFYHKTEVRPSEFNTPLYTSPPKREWQGLTDEEVFDIWLNEMPAPDKVFYQKLCRSVEAKLKQKNA